MPRLSKHGSAPSATRRGKATPIPIPTTSAISTRPSAPAPVRPPPSKTAFKSPSPPETTPVLPSFHSQPRNIAVVYRECIRRGLIRREQVAPNTFRRIVKKFDLLKPLCDHSPKARLAFAKAHANDLWQGDTLHGPYLDTGLRGKPIKTYLICFIDDASRVVPHGAFHAADDTTSLIDTFQTALHKRGVPKAVYVDNGSNYTAKEFSTICVRLGTVLIHTPVRDGAAKGKIERFFRTVRDEFLTLDLSHIHTLRDLNNAFIQWLETTYHNRIHTTLGMKPIDRFGLDLDRIRYLAGNPFSTELFMLEDTRKVRIDNTFSFNARRYEAPRDMRNKTITEEILFPVRTLI